MTIPALPSPGQSWTDDASTAPLGGYARLVPSEYPGWVTIDSRGPISGSLVADTATVGPVGPLFPRRYFARRYFGARYFATAPLTESVVPGQYVFSDELTGTGRLILVGSSATVF